jgi:hypothetical protein
MAEHAVIVHLPLSDDRFGSSEEQQAHFALQERVAEAIGDAEAGEFDGDEVGQGEWVLYMYGPDADHLFSAIEPLLRSSPLATGGYAIKRYGEAADREARECRISL